jgi:acyl-homoserine lactone acylase PvdQ
VQVCSQQGLNVYGAVTWGQFFIYQGFNQNCGWMHTSSNVDVSDMYSEEIIKKGKGFVYKYDNKWFPVKEKKILLKIKTELGFKDSSIIAYFTHHGPVMAFRNNQFISVRSNNRNINGLIQSWQRTKAGGLEDYKKAMHIRANTSNNTVFADKKGNIAYWHGNFIPIRDKKYNWGKVVDGTTSATEWKGIHSVEEGVHVYNPANGWIQNCNSTPFSVCGSNSPKRENYPVYMAPDGENFRAINAVKVLGSENKFNIDKIIAAGYNRYLSAFGILIPALINRFEKNLVSAEPFFKQLEEPIAILKSWDYNADEQSIAQTLAIGWAEKLNPAIKKVYVDEGEPDQVAVTKHFAATATKEQLLLPLLEVVNDLQKKFGTWKMEWGEINRYQRVGNEVDQKYDDARESFPVPFASSLWGMLPAYNSNYFPGTDKRYGVSGNSFICAVEFGKRIRARSLLAGGESSNINSPHFTDQLLMYTKGMFKEVLFYKEEVLKHAEKTYHPGKQGR